jgi:hypothetical protein
MGNSAHKGPKGPVGFKLSACTQNYRRHPPTGEYFHHRSIHNSSTSYLNLVTVLSCLVIIHHVIPSISFKEPHALSRVGEAPLVTKRRASACPKMSPFGRNKIENLAKISLPPFASSTIPLANASHRDHPHHMDELSPAELITLQPIWTIRR